MLFREISRILGRTLLSFAFLLLIPLAVAITYEWVLGPVSHPQPPSATAFLKSIGVCLLLGLLFVYWGKSAKGTLYRRESILLVVIIWFMTAFLGGLPFLFSGTLKSPIDSTFEAMSALTTTGSTIFHAKAFDPASGLEIPITLHPPQDSQITYQFYGTISPVLDPVTKTALYTGVEAVSRALLFWRSLMQWVGGMGVVVLFIAIMPALSTGGKLLFEAEMPGPSKEGMTPRIKETASLLWKIYCGLTASQVILLMITNPSLPLFDALTLTFSTISTGGFSIHNEGIAFYQNNWTYAIIMLFMILGAINFTLYFHCLRAKIYRLYEPELTSFLITLTVGSLLVSAVIWNHSAHLLSGNNALFSLPSALFNGALQAISAQTSTGFALANYTLWPSSAQLLLLLLMYMGGMSGSTSGGIKIARLAILTRTLLHRILTIFRPDAVRRLKIGDKEISEGLAISTLVFFCILITMSVLGIFLLVFDGIDTTTAFGIVASSINNAGLPFGAAGPTQSCAFLPPLSKLVSLVWMALGRLEFFALIVLLIPAFWTGKGR
jgi:trk system potassium uptake protein